MGQMTNMQIADWQKKAGIEPATGERAKALDDLSRQAYELIRVIELERSGIRDGDGYWHGSDALDGTIRNITTLWEQMIVSVDLCPDAYEKFLESATRHDGNSDGLPF